MQKRAEILVDALSKQTPTWPMHGRPVGTGLALTRFAQLGV